MDKPGFVDGKHFTAYVNIERTLKDEERFDETEELLLKLVAVTESESPKNKLGVAPWYYERLATLYRKQKRKNDEIKILERFERQIHAHGAKPAKLLARLAKLRSP